MSWFEQKSPSCLHISIKWHLCRGFTRTYSKGPKQNSGRREWKLCGPRIQSDNLHGMDVELWNPELLCLQVIGLLSLITDCGFWRKPLFLGEIRPECKTGSVKQITLGLGNTTQADAYTQRRTINVCSGCVNPDSRTRTHACRKIKKRNHISHHTGLKVKVKETC